MFCLCPVGLLSYLLDCEGQLALRGLASRATNFICGENFDVGEVSGLALTLVMLLRAASGLLSTSQDREFPGFCILGEVYHPTQLNCVI